VWPQNPNHFSALHNFTALICETRDSHQPWGLTFKVLFVADPKMHRK
jgi:hypothetical protein